jgi:amino acid transporter
MANNLFLSAVISGAIVMGYAVVGLFFLRFWRQSRDRLFGFFALAFFVLGVQRLLLALTTQTNEGSLPLYVIRLLAFLIILAAIIDKNRGAKKSSS